MVFRSTVCPAFTGTVCMICHAPGKPPHATAKRKTPRTTAIFTGACCTKTARQNWRWMLHCDDSPWYPAMRLFRQPHNGDWPSIVQQVCTQLGLLHHNTGAGDYKNNMGG